MSNTLNDKIKKLLVAPGKGVYTVHTGRERRLAVFKKLYNVNTDQEAEVSWKKSLAEELKNTDLLILGIPSDNGGGILRGANWGPLAIRDQIYPWSGKHFLDLGDIKVIPHLLHDKYLNQETISLCREALYKNSQEDLPVSPLSITEDMVDTLYKKYPLKKVFSLGGDHSVSYPITKAWIKNQKQQNNHFAIIHFDAHTDLSVNRLGIDLCFGTWARHILDDLAQKDHLIQIGIRSTAQTKDHWEKQVGVKQYWAKDVHEKTALVVAKEITQKLKKEGVTHLYISFDIDAIDAEFASATGTPEHDGLRPHECIEIINALHADFKITGADLVEVAPYIQSDQKHQNTLEPLSTLTTAKMIAEALIHVLSDD